MPLRIDADGALVLAGDDPSADLTLAGRPARLVLVRAPLLASLLAESGAGEPEDDASAASAATPVATAPSPDPGEEPDEHDRWDAVLRWPTTDERAPLRPPPRGALVSLAAVLGVVALVAAGIWLLRGAGEGAGEAGPAVVQDDLPAALRATLGVPSLPRGAAVEHACAGGLAILATPLPREANCDLVIGAEATVSATVLLAPGGGCVSASRADGLIAELRGRQAPDPRPDGLEPVGVRPRRGGACVSPDVTSMRAGFYPLVDLVILALRGDVAGSASSREVADDLRATETSAPVTTLVLDRPVS